MSIDELITNLCDLRRKHAGAGRCKATMEIVTPASKCFQAEIDEMIINTQRTEVILRSQEQAQRVEIE